MTLLSPETKNPCVSVTLEGAFYIFRASWSSSTGAQSRQTLYFEFFSYSPEKGTMRRGATCRSTPLNPTHWTFFIKSKRVMLFFELVELLWMNVRIFEDWEYWETCLVFSLNWGQLRSGCLQFWNKKGAQIGKIRCAAFTRILNLFGIFWCYEYLNFFLFLSICLPTQPPTSTPASRDSCRTMTPSAWAWTSRGCWGSTTCSTSLPGQSSQSLTC